MSDRLVRRNGVHKLAQNILLLKEYSVKIYELTIVFPVKSFAK